MSISLNNIYCKHYLKTSKLQEYYKSYKCKYESIKKSPHILFHIKDTIHYNTLINNDYEIYKELIIKTNQHEHSIPRFNKLLTNIDMNKMEKIQLVYDYDTNKYLIKDGVHRFCILYYKKLIKDSIDLKYLDIKYDDSTVNKIKQLLSGTINNSHYNGWHNRTTYGYHSFNIFNINIPGQRNPKQRLDIIKQHINFENKNVIDFGCNNGGMLLHLPEINNGIGLDFDGKCIQTATNLKNILKYNNNLTFLKQDLNELHDFKQFLNIKIDIAFLLSLGSWVKNWPKLYNQTLENVNIIILETNNDDEGKPQLDFFKSKKCNIKLISDASRDDMTKNYRRKTYIIWKTIKTNNQK